ncbi:dihydrofolate reductase [Patescibacteria group bacterium]
MILSLIAAIDEKNGLGKDNKLLLKIPSDLKRFKKITLHHPIIMGRKTFQSIGKVLPSRVNIIISRNKNFKVKNGFTFDKLEKAISFAKSKDQKEVFIIGGGQIYKQTIAKANKLYLTIIKGNLKADTFFPKFENFNKKTYDSGWKKYKKFEFKFVELEKEIEK